MSRSWMRWAALPGFLGIALLAMAVLWVRATPTTTAVELPATPTWTPPGMPRPAAPTDDEPRQAFRGPMSR